MMYMMTELEYAQIVDAVSCRSSLPKHSVAQIALGIASETLKAMQPVEAVGWLDTIDGADLTYSIDELMGGNTDGLLALYTPTKE